ncbi:MAG TPA: inositol monophosphatase, partial [Bryobacteraceae bacterium]|nr:inositol monophosphatase [Bryobacteraceae bacterium]
MPYDKELTIGADIARKAGELALKIREGNIGVESKADESPVTIADKACEKLIVEQLRAAFPEDGLLGEEGAMQESTNGRRWIIDPIDGTRDFIRGTRAWSVLIGLEENGSVVAGHAYFPATHEMFSAAKGEGAYWDGRRVHASTIEKKNEALLCVNGLGFMHRYPFAKDLVNWISEFWTVRSMGGCLDAMLLATGRADAWIEAQAKPWDLAPLKIIAEEAGCVTFDFEGKD